MITLAIIGVVAALTIPVVVANYQKKALYTQFMKSYNTIQNVFQMSSQENENFELLLDDYQNEALFKKYLGNYLKIQAYCMNNSSACMSDSELKASVFNDEIQVPYKESLEIAPSALLQDGTIVIMDSLGIVIDINGAKAPNKYGRDLFVFTIVKINDTERLVAEGLYDHSGNQMTLSEIIDEGCSDSNFGFGCGARLLIEGKMSY